MKKYLMLTVITLQTAILFAQSETAVYNENGVLLSYSAQKYNSVVLNGKSYDQYEVKFIFKNKSEKYIHNPQICRIGFTTEIKHPSSSSEIDFTEKGNTNGYVEYTDGTPLPENLSQPLEDDKHGRVITRTIIKKGVSNECVKYILIKEGEDIGEPTFTIEFNHTFPIIVNGSDQLIETWITRQAKGISLNNVTSWPMTIRNLHEAQTECGSARPIGKKDDVINNTNETKNENQDSILNVLKKKMLNSFQEISDYLMENTPGVKVEETQTDHFGGKSKVTKIYTYACTIKLKLNGCDGTFEDINITGSNTTYNANVRSTLEKLIGKYIVKENKHCITQKGTLQLSEE